jgi:hypothetical protein
MKVAIVDVDDTLVFGGRGSRLCWHLSLFFQRLGRKLQKTNRLLVHRLSNYDRVIILTSRDSKDIEFTRRQLNSKGIKYDEIFGCPRKETMINWKIETVQKIIAKYQSEIVWIDDVFLSDFSKQVQDAGLLRTTQLTPTFERANLPPENLPLITEWERL